LDTSNGEKIPGFLAKIVRGEVPTIHAMR